MGLVAASGEHCADSNMRMEKPYILLLRCNTSSILGIIN